MIRALALATLCAACQPLGFDMLDRAWTFEAQREDGAKCSGVVVTEHRADGADVHSGLFVAICGRAIDWSVVAIEGPSLSWALMDFDVAVQCDTYEQPTPTEITGVKCRDTYQQAWRLTLTGIGGGGASPRDSAP